METMFYIIVGLLLVAFLIVGFLARPPLYPTDEELNKE